MVTGAPSPSPRPHQVVALTIAGNDPSGGAGVVRDLRTFEANGAWGCAVLTALTAQSPRRVTGVHPVPADFVAAQLDTLLTDCRIDTVKIGMLAEAPIIDVVAARLADELRGVPVVLDPVMVSTSGARLLDADAVEAMRRLVPLPDLITPNLPEAAVLLGADEAGDEDTMRAQARALRSQLGARAVLVKGGHLADTTDAVDVLADEAGERAFRSPRVTGVDTHGTGCTLSSALAALRPQVPDWDAAVPRAKACLDLAG